MSRSVVVYIHKDDTALFVDGQEVKAYTLPGLYERDPSDYFQAVVATDKLEPGPEPGVFEIPASHPEASQYASIFNIREEAFQEAVAEARQAREERMKRKAASFWHCRIPDWTGQGGMVEFWINEDGTFETDDGHIDDRMIREGIARLLHG